MDSIEKALRKLTKQDRDALKVLLLRVQAGDFEGLDVKKLKSKKDIFRVRKGKYRVIFRKQGDLIMVLALERRSDTTYK
jgi:mRNA-degrading endonuclease RelE of RelBE toxin-antitoxin system